MITLLLVAATATLLPQNAVEATSSEHVETLRNQIHGMRTTLLLGGARVRQADDQAIEFYGSKIEIIERRLDQVDAELAEKRATYDLALDRTLEAEDRSSRQTAVEEASRLRTAISYLESESTDLGRKQSGLSKMIAALHSRQRERSRLAVQLETAGGANLEFGFPLPGVGLGPTAVAREASAGLENEGLAMDLLERDPLRARRLLFEIDPQRYWERFSLRPPQVELWEALKFPQTDLPGLR